MIDLGKHSVLGVRIDAVDYAAAVERIVDCAPASGGRWRFRRWRCTA